MIEGLRMVADENVKTETAPQKMTDMIRFYNDQMDSMIDRLYVSARVLVGDNMRDPHEKFDAPTCLVEDVKLLGERIKKLTDLCDIIGGCL